MIVAAENGDGIAAASKQIEPALFIEGKMGAAKMTERQNRIMIYGPKDDGSYVVVLRTADGESLAISVPRGETTVLKHFQARMPYGLVLPDDPS